MMANKQSTFIQLPADVSNPMELRRFLDKLIQQLDTAFGNRGNNAFVSGQNFLSGVTTLQELITRLQTEITKYEPKFEKHTAFNKDFGTIAGTVTEGGTTTNNPKQDAISDLNQTISDPPTQAEVQAISDKVDEILNALRNANIISI